MGANDDVTEFFGGFLRVKEINPLQEQVIEKGKCPFCLRSVELEFEVDFCKSYRCENCERVFWL